MQIDQKIILISSHSAQIEQLSHIFSFLGENCELITPNQVNDYLDDTCFRIVVIHLECMDIAEINALAGKYPWQPILVMGDKNDVLIGNILGVIQEPVNYPQLTELMHYCQVYAKSHHLELPIKTKRTKLFRSLVGCSTEIAKVRELIGQVATSDASVLILGDSGTGKEVVARNIHFLSERQKGPFIPVNCGAIPPELLESELFGHEKGAFTGAISSRKGRFELAEGGTLFLDEIGDMPLQMQVKLLRVLQEKEFERVGGNKTIKSNVRVVAATHQDLENMIEENTFRQDLYYRLNVFPIDMPSLSQRQEDIPLLLQEIVTRNVNEGNCKVRFTRRALDSLKLHEWTGNVRELSNLVERLAILYPNALVDVNDLPLKYRHIDVPEFSVEPMTSIAEHEMIASIFSEAAPINFANKPSMSELPSEGINLKDLLAEIEIDMIKQALEKQDNVVSRAADMLGIRRTTLVEKMRKYDINKE